MDLHRLRVVDFDTLVSEKKGANEDIAEPEMYKQEKCKDDKDDSDNKNDDTVSRNGKKVAGAETITPRSFKTSSLIRRKSKSEIFRIPLKYKLKKPALKLNSSLEDIAKSSKHVSHSDRKKRNLNFFNRKGSGDQKIGDAKKNNEGCKKNEEIKFLFARETPSFIRHSRKRIKNEGAKSFKLPKDIFGFKKSNRLVDPYLYQMSCNYLNRDQSSLKKIKKGFRKQKPTPTPTPVKTCVCKHHAMRVLNSGAASFGDHDETPSIYYNLNTHSHPRRKRHRRDYSVYEEVFQRDNPFYWAKDQTVSVSPSSLVPITKYCCDACVGASKPKLSPRAQRRPTCTHPVLSSSQRKPLYPQRHKPCPPQHSTPSPSCASNAPNPNKSHVVTTGSKDPSDIKTTGYILTCSRNPILSGIFRTVTAFYIKNRSSGKNCIKYAFFGLLFVVWSPCLLAVILAWVIMCPVRLTNMLANNKTKKSFPIINSLMNRFRKKGPGSEYHRIHGENLRQKNRNFMTSVASWSARAAGTVVNSFNAMISMLKTRNKPPPCAGSSFLTSSHPNPKRRYTLFYADNRGWMMKPLRRSNSHSYTSSRVVQSMRCEFRPKFWKRLKCDQRCQTKMDLCNSVAIECPAHRLQYIKSKTKRERSSPAGDAACVCGNILASYSGGRNLPPRLKTTRQNTSGSAMFMPVASHRLPCQQVNIAPKSFHPTSGIPPLSPSFYYPIVNTKHKTLNSTKTTNMSHEDHEKNYLSHRKNGTLPSGIMFGCPCGTKHPVITNRDILRNYRFDVAGKTLNMSTKYTPTYKTNYLKQLSSSNKIGFKGPYTTKHTGKTPLCARSASFVDKRKTIIPKYTHDAYCPLKSKYLGNRRNVLEETQRQSTTDQELHYAHTRSVSANLSHSALTKQAITDTNKIELIDKSQSLSTSSFRQKINSFVAKAQCLSKQSLRQNITPYTEKMHSLSKQSFKPKGYDFADKTQCLSKQRLKKKEMDSKSNTQRLSKKPVHTKEKALADKTHLSKQSFKQKEMNFAGNPQLISKPSLKLKEMDAACKRNRFLERSSRPNEMNFVENTQIWSKQYCNPNEIDLSDNFRLSKEYLKPKEMDLTRVAQHLSKQSFTPIKTDFTVNTQLSKQSLMRKEMDFADKAQGMSHHVSIQNEINFADKTQHMSENCFPRKDSRDKIRIVSNNNLRQLVKATQRPSIGSTSTDYGMVLNRPGRAIQLSECACKSNLVDKTQGISKYAFTRKLIDLIDKAQGISKHVFTRKRSSLTNRAQEITKAINLVDRGQTISTHSSGRTDNLLEETRNISKQSLGKVVKCACGASKPSECACKYELNRAKGRSEHTASNKISVICGCGVEEEIECPCVTIRRPCPPTGPIDAHRDKVRIKQFGSYQKVAGCDCLTDRKVDKMVVECRCWTDKKIEKKLVECGCWTDENIDKKLVECGCWTENKVDCPCQSVRQPCPLGIQTLDAHNIDAATQPFKEDAATSQKDSSRIENASECACKSDSTKKALHCSCWTDRKIEQKVDECGCWPDRKKDKKLVECGCWTQDKVDCPCQSVHQPCPLGTQTLDAHNIDAATQPFKEDAATSQKDSSRIESVSECACKSESTKKALHCSCWTDRKVEQKVDECGCWPDRKKDKKLVECACWTEDKVDCPCQIMQQPCPAGTQTLNTHNIDAATHPFKQDTATSQKQLSWIEKPSQCACKSKLNKTQTEAFDLKKSKSNKVVECGCWPDSKIDQKAVECGCWTERKEDCPCLQVPYLPGAGTINGNRTDLAQHYYKGQATTTQKPYKQIESATQSTYEPEKESGATSHSFIHPKTAKLIPSAQHPNKCTCKNAPNAQPQPGSTGRLHTIASKLHNVLSKQLKQTDSAERLTRTSGRESLHTSRSVIANIPRRTKTTASQGPPVSHEKADGKTMHKTSSTDNPNVIGPLRLTSVATDCPCIRQQNNNHTLSTSQTPSTASDSKMLDNTGLVKQTPKMGIASDCACQTHETVASHKKSKFSQKTNLEEHPSKQRMKSSQKQSSPSIQTPYYRPSTTDAKQTPKLGIAPDCACQTQEKIDAYKKSLYSHETGLEEHPSTQPMKSLQKQSSPSIQTPYYRPSTTDAKQAPKLGIASDCACQTQEKIAAYKKSLYSHETGLEEHPSTQPMKSLQKQSSASRQAPNYRPSTTDAKRFCPHETCLPEPNQQKESQKQTPKLGIASDCACQTQEKVAAYKKSLYSHKSGLEEHPSTHPMKSLQKQSSAARQPPNYRPNTTDAKRLCPHETCLPEPNQQKKSQKPSPKLEIASDCACQTQEKVATYKKRLYSHETGLEEHPSTQPMKSLQKQSSASRQAPYYRPNTTDKKSRYSQGSGLPEYPPTHTKKASQTPHYTTQKKTSKFRMASNYRPSKTISKQGSSQTSSHISQKEFKYPRKTDITGRPSQQVTSSQTRLRTSQKRSATDGSDRKKTEHTRLEEQIPNQGLNASPAKSLSFHRSVDKVRSNTKYPNQQTPRKQSSYQPSMTDKKSQQRYSNQRINGRLSGCPCSPKIQQSKHVLSRICLTSNKCPCSANNHTQDPSVKTSKLSRSILSGKIRSRLFGNTKNQQPQTSKLKSLPITSDSHCLHDSQPPDNISHLTSKNDKVDKKTSRNAKKSSITQLKATECTCSVERPSSSQIPPSKVSHNSSKFSKLVTKLHSKLFNRKITKQTKIPQSLICSSKCPYAVNNSINFNLYNEHKQADNSHQHTKCSCLVDKGSSSRHTVYKMPLQTNKSRISLPRRSQILNTSQLPSFEIYSTHNLNHNECHCPRSKVSDDKTTDCVRNPMKLDKSHPSVSRHAINLQSNIFKHSSLLSKMSLCQHDKCHCPVDNTSYTQLLLSKTSLHTGKFKKDKTDPIFSRRSQQSRASHHSSIFTLIPHDCKCSINETFSTQNESHHSIKSKHIGNGEPPRFLQHHPSHQPEISKHSRQLSPQTTSSAEEQLQYPHRTKLETEEAPRYSQQLPKIQSETSKFSRCLSSDLIPPAVKQQPDLTGQQPKNIPFEPDISRYSRQVISQTTPPAEIEQRVPSKTMSHHLRKTTIGAQEPGPSQHLRSKPDVSRYSHEFSSQTIPPAEIQQFPSEEMSHQSLKTSTETEGERQQLPSAAMTELPRHTTTRPFSRPFSSQPTHSTDKQFQPLDHISEHPRKSTLGTEEQTEYPNLHTNGQSTSQPKPLAEEKLQPSDQMPQYPRGSKLETEEQAGFPYHGPSGQSTSQLTPLAEEEQRPIDQGSKYALKRTSQAVEQSYSSDQVSQYPRKKTIGTERQPGYPLQLPDQQPVISKRSSLFRSPAKRISDTVRKLSDKMTQQPPQSEEKNHNVPQQYTQLKKSNTRPVDPFQPLIPILPGTCKCSENLRLLTLLVEHLQKTAIGKRSKQNIDMRHVPSHQPILSQRRVHSLVPTGENQYRNSKRHISHKTTIETDEPAKSSQNYSNRQSDSCKYLRRLSSQSILSASEERRHKTTMVNEASPAFPQHVSSHQPVIYKRSSLFHRNKQKQLAKKLGSLSDIISQYQRKSDETHFAFVQQNSRRQLENSKHSRLLYSKPSSNKRNVSPDLISRPPRQMEIGTQKRRRFSQHLQQPHKILGMYTCSGKKILLSAANLTDYYKTGHQITIHRSEVAQNPLSTQNLKNQFSSVCQLLPLQNPPDKISHVSRNTEHENKPPPGLLQRPSSRQVRKCSTDCGRLQQLLQPAITQQSPYPDFNRVSMRYPAHISPPKQPEKSSGPVQTEPIPAPTQLEHIPYPAHYYQPVAGVSPPPNYARYPCFINPANKCGPKSCNDEVALRRAYKRRPLRYTPPKQQIPKKIPTQKKSKKAVKVKKKKKTSGSKLTRCCGCVRDLIQEAEKEAWPTDVTCRPMYIHTMKRKPCFWIYECCPSMYPAFLNCFKFQQNIFQMFMYCLSICFWCPFIFCVYFCIDIICRSG